MKLSRETLVGVLDRLPTAVLVVNPRREVRYANLAAQRVLHSHVVRTGALLPEPSPLAAVVQRVFDAGVVRDVSITTDGRTLRVSGTADRAGGLAALTLEDVSLRSRRARSDEDFVVNASHEILSPIAAIAGAVQVLQDGAKEDPEARDRFLAHIATASERLTSTAQALLALAKAEAGLGGPRLELVPLQGMLDEVSRGKDDVTVTCASQVGVLGDADLLRQAVGTLVENARRYSAAGVEITVAEDGNVVTVDIVDHGDGILPENLERATNRFFTADGRDSGGFGVGLSIAERAAKAIGGTLELSSSRTGTRARLRLPSARLL